MQEEKFFMHFQAWNYMKMHDALSPLPIQHLHVHGQKTEDSNIFQHIMEMNYILP